MIMSAADNPRPGLRLLRVRDEAVLIDRALAALYGVKVKAFNQANFSKLIHSDSQRPTARSTLPPVIAMCRSPSRTRFSNSSNGLPDSR
jgi:hypothetical protein